MWIPALRGWNASWTDIKALRIKLCISRMKRYFLEAIQAEAEGWTLGWLVWSYIIVRRELSFEVSLWLSHWGMKGWVMLYADMQHRQQTGRQLKHWLCMEGWGKMGWDCWCSVFELQSICCRPAKNPLKDHSNVFIYHKSFFKCSKECCRVFRYLKVFLMSL